MTYQDILSLLLFAGILITYHWAKSKIADFDKTPNEENSKI